MIFPCDSVGLKTWCSWASWAIWIVYTWKTKSLKPPDLVKFHKTSLHNEGGQPSMWQSFSFSLQISSGFWVSPHIKTWVRRDRVTEPLRTLLLWSEKWAEEISAWDSDLELEMQVFNLYGFSFNLGLGLWEAWLLFLVFLGVEPM